VLDRMMRTLDARSAAGAVAFASAAVAAVDGTSASLHASDSLMADTRESDSIQQQIVRDVSAWPGVTIATHRFGGIEFRLGRRELGHLHGSRLADLPFPVRVREELVAAGRAEPHHVLPESGWVSCYIRDAGDVARVVSLFRLNYERPWTAAGSQPLQRTVR
jgi:hypothetical protein